MSWFLIATFVFVGGTEPPRGGNLFTDIVSSYQTQEKCTDALVTLKTAKFYLVHGVCVQGVGDK